jgi:cytochrome c peroxidase
MRYEAEGSDLANAGLQHARVFLEPVNAMHSWITHAGLWTLGGIVAIKEMSGPEIPWKRGRTDYVDDSRLPLRDRLPDGTQGAGHLRWIFYRMGFDNQEIRSPQSWVVPL